MRQITRIKPVDKKRFEIDIDGKLAFILYKGELRSFGLQVNEAISDKDYDEIINNILPKRAVLRCGHLLEKRDYTKQQLRDKLHDAHYPETVIDYALNKMLDYGFINDLRYSERYIESKINKISMNSIRTKLFQKGIAKDIINQAFENISDDGIIQDEEELIIKLLTKRHYFDSAKDSKEKSKQFCYLMNKGFSSAAIKKCLNVEEA